ncbi:unnamed protein product [Protopolystoma xenopodis]|uniref:Uncharacterized protein n=1 Tax=Protopolystoma xenopodis TaxID=117903 RepID=A0A3S5AZL3_9PLAT|nr:unnamed protein product [Protopolystoma xenopodis]
MAINVTEWLLAANRTHGKVLFVTDELDEFNMLFRIALHRRLLLGLFVPATCGLLTALLVWVMFVVYTERPPVVLAYTENMYTTDLEIATDFGNMDLLTLDQPPRRSSKISSQHRSTPSYLRRMRNFYSSMDNNAITPELLLTADLDLSEDSSYLNQISYPKSDCFFISDRHKNQLLIPMLLNTRPRASWKAWTRDSLKVDSDSHLPKLTTNDAVTTTKESCFYSSRNRVFSMPCLQCCMKPGIEQPLTSWSTSDVFDHAN